jgi:hypothetical protein
MSLLRRALHIFYETTYVTHDKYAVQDLRGQTRIRRVFERLMYRFEVNIKIYIKECELDT